MIQQWEYNCIDVPEQFPGLELARLGLEGWELVNVRLEQIVALGRIADTSTALGTSSKGRLKMSLKLPPEVQQRLLDVRSGEEARRIVFASLNNEQLVATAKFWIAHCEAPKRNPPGAPVYDSTFWHIILPELLRRL